MQFMKTLLWIVVAVVVALFAIRNGEPVTVNLWSDLQMVTPLWVIVILAYLAGLLPILAVHRASRWRWRRRLEQSERTPGDGGQVTASGAEPISPAAASATPPPAGI